MEPIAIIGLGCRFPKANSPKTFWQLLKAGQQAVGTVPSERWDVETFYDPDPETVGKMSSCRGGFLDGVDRFDANFFGISEIEAQHIDPQQRLFLEVAWEALEHAAIAPLGLGGSATGVFTGLCTIDYHRLLYRDFGCIGPYSGTGTTMSITANRLSYLLDLRGPSMAVDAACSSSLVAVHLACQSLRAEESDLCLAGGVNLILSPDSMISSSQTGLLSARGECRPFDAGADGYVRGEGCGVVVLKRLSDAQANGDNILAVIRGSAINQDGLSNSMTAPNGLAQQALIEKSLAASQADAKDISYVEAHAVGTPLGDAIEFKALKKTLLSGREMPCVIGSVKPNIGHLEAASGIASLIKVVLALQHEEIPPQLNFEQANDYVALEEDLLEIVPEGRPWPRHQKARLAGVSTFGFGGTNAHLVIAEAPAKAEALAERLPQSDRTHHILTLTAKSKTALRSLAQRYSKYLVDNNLVGNNLVSNNLVDSSESTADLARLLGDICFTANTGRSHFAERLCLVSHSTDQLWRQLEQFAEGEETVLAHQFIAERVKGRKRPSVVFVFPEPTAELLSLGHSLYQSQPTFREFFDQCAQLAAVPLSFVAEPGSVRVTGFVVSYAIASLWQSWGIQPRATAGEGLGQYVAACVSGLLEISEVLPALSAAASDLNFSVTPSGDTTPRIPLLALETELAGYDVALEMGTGSVGVPTAATRSNKPRRLSLRGDLSVWSQLLTHLGQLFVQGVAVDWARFDQGYGRHRCSLPTYPFERSSHWFSQPVSQRVSEPAANREKPTAKNSPAQQDRHKSLVNIPKEVASQRFNAASNN
ncbi:MAG: type I polyketide synthase [Cyanobacteria bacterium J06621_3]